MYSCCGIAFDGKGNQNFGNDFARNVIIYGADNNSSSHTDNRKNNFLVLGEGDASGINGTFCALEKKFSILVKQRKNFALVYITVMIIIT